MVGRPLEDCLMILSVVLLLWLMAFVFQDRQTSVRRRRNTFSQMQISLPVVGREWNARLLPTWSHTSTVAVCFCDPFRRWGIFKKLRFKKENISSSCTSLTLLVVRPQIHRCADARAQRLCHRQLQDSFFHLQQKRMWWAQQFREISTAHVRVGREKFQRLLFLLMQF